MSSGSSSGVLSSAILEIVAGILPVLPLLWSGVLAHWSGVEWNTE